MLQHLHHVDHLTGFYFYQTGQLLYLRSVCHHCNRCQAEVEVEYQDEHDGRDGRIVSHRAEILLEALRNLHPVVEVVCIVETFHASP